MIRTPLMQKNRIQIEIIGTLKPAHLFSLQRLSGGSVEDLLGFIWADKNGTSILWDTNRKSPKFGLKSFLWEAHDGRSFGRQHIVATAFNSTVSFNVITDNVFNTTVIVEQHIRVNDNMNFLVYSSVPPSMGRIDTSENPAVVTRLSCDSWDVERCISRQVAISGSRNSWIRLSSNVKDNDQGSSLSVYLFRLKKKTSEYSLRFNIILGNGGEIHTENDLEEKEDRWRKKVSEKFPGISSFSAVASVFGNLGFFQGSLLTDGGERSDMSLLTIVPSRSFFPRGFLWDDGFHLLVISKLDMEISCAIIKSWFDLQDEKTGWIPREVALSAEDRSRIPEKFVKQVEQISNNPPSLIMSLLLVKKVKGNIDFLNKLEIPLNRWFNFLEVSQASSKKGCFRWKGRSSSHCLASGLDDYPRGSVVNEDECHLDLHSWLIFFAKRMKKLFPANSLFWENKENELFTNFKKNLFNDDSGIFSDFLSKQISRKFPSKSLWSEDGRCSRNLPCDPDSDSPCCSSSGWCGNSKYHCECEGCWRRAKSSLVHSNELEKNVFSPHFGYVSLVPIILGIISPESEISEKLISRMNKTMITNFGVSSLAMNDALFGKGENYWRGEIWGNFQLLICIALQNYGHAELAKSIRNNFLETVHAASSTYFEHYSPINGRGSGVNPFTGWTAVAIAFLESPDALAHLNDILDFH